MSADRWQRVERLFPSFKSYAGKQWLEEDADWAIAALAFPEHFTAQDLRAAVRTVRHGESEVAAWVETIDGAEIRQRIGQWIMENAANWERGSSGSAPPGYSYPNGWAVYIRVGDGARQSIVEKPHDWKAIYTDADLDEIRVAALTD
jgi:hypothetical protein